MSIQLPTAANAASKSFRYFVGCCVRIVLVLASASTTIAESTLLEEIVVRQSAHFRSISSLNARATTEYTPVELANSGDQLGRKQTTSMEHFRLSGSYWRKDSGVDLTRRPDQLDYSKSVACFDGDTYQLFRVEQWGLFVDTQRPIVDPYYSPPASIVPYGFAYDSGKEYAFQALAQPQSWEKVLAGQHASVVEGTQRIDNRDCVVIELYPSGSLFSDGKPKYRKVYLAPDIGYFPVCYETYFLEGARNLGYRMTVIEIDQVQLDAGPFPAAMSILEEFFREDGKLLFTMKRDIERDTFTVNEPISDDAFTVPAVFAQTILDRNNPEASLDLTSAALTNSLEHGLLQTDSAEVASSKLSPPAPPENSVPGAVRPSPMTTPIWLILATSILLMLAGAIALFRVLRHRSRVHDRT